MSEILLIGHLFPSERKGYWVNVETHAEQSSEQWIKYAAIAGCSVAFHLNEGIARGFHARYIRTENEAP